MLRSKMSFNMRVIKLLLKYQFPFPVQWQNNSIHYVWAEITLRNSFNICAMQKWFWTWFYCFHATCTSKAKIYLGLLHYNETNFLFSLLGTKTLQVFQITLRKFTSRLKTTKMKLLVFNTFFQIFFPLHSEKTSYMQMINYLKTPCFVHIGKKAQLL